MYEIRASESDLLGVFIIGYGLQSVLRFEACVKNLLWRDLTMTNPRGLRNRRPHGRFERKRKKPFVI
jgi:hypothetical protein